MDLFTYLMAKKGHNTHRDLFSYLLGKGEGGGIPTHFEGTNLTINNTLSSRIKDIQLKGQASQDTTPTTVTPVPIKVVTGDNSIVIKGKNLFEESSEWNFTASIGIGEFAGQFPRNTAGNRRTYFYLVKPNTKYTISFAIPGDRLIIWENYSIINPKDYTILNPVQLNNQLADISSNIPTEYTFTTSGNAKMVAIYYSLNTLPTNLEIKQTQIYPISLGALELAKIGTHQDYIYGSPNNWYSTNYFTKIESYNGETITTEYLSTTGGLDIGATVYYYNGGSNPLQITDTTLINQLNNLYNARTYNEQTNIYTTYEGGNEQMIISFTALIKN